MGDPKGERRIAGITLDEHTVVRRSPDIEHERAVAIFDLLEENRFAPASGLDGPFHLHLAIEENRLSIEVRSAANGAGETIVLPLAPFRGIVRDYFMICENYYQAIRRASLAQIEAIDVGRRSLHDEGSTLLMERLAEKVVIDHDTARRLFTLICVLHLRGSACGDGAAPRARFRFAAPARPASANRAGARPGRSRRYRRDAAAW
jgi:uncharacterized protein (UPF0262 family)